MSIALNGRLDRRWDAEPFVARLTSRADRPAPLREREVLLLGAATDALPAGFRACLQLDEKIATANIASSAKLPDSLGYLRDGDIVRISPRTGELFVMYRHNAPVNFIFIGEDCNCRCIMCPQPPRQSHGSWIDAWLSAIPLMSPDTGELVITGGEPTMAPAGLLRLVAACRNFLPRTALHLLSNGRRFNYLSLCQEIARIKHPDLVIGIPIYSDVGHVHDYIVQASGAFDQTVRGIMNLARCGHRLELRIVLLQQNSKQLPRLASFIARNMPFVEHVAIMGLEMTGYAKANVDSLWIDPSEYGGLLARAVDELSVHGMRVSIYNHPLCVLPTSLWPLARNSISDWKREFEPACESCKVRDRCGGTFVSTYQTGLLALRPVQGNF